MQPNIFQKTLILAVVVGLGLGFMSSPAQARVSLSDLQAQIDALQDQVDSILDQGCPPGQAVVGIDPNGTIICSDFEVPWEGVRPFTTCGQTGQLGPSQAQCDAAYSATTLAGEVTLVTGIQEWTVQMSGTYRIEAFGAQGESAEPGRFGGRGAKMAGDFYLTEGQVLQIIVGQMGVESSASGGGGGGSFVVDKLSGDPLIVAGGGGGIRQVADQNGCDGRISQEGGTGSGYYQTHGCGQKSGSIGDGGIVSRSSYGSGGGGFYGNGQNDSSYGQGGIAFVNGGTGGASYSCSSAVGGFGSGGSGNGCFGGGGGGGYSGGDGGLIAGGGGSINTGSNQDNASGVNSAPGLVFINLL